MVLPIELQTVLTLLFAGKFLAATKFIGYRIASWFGTGFFYKKGKDSGKKRFYWAAFCVWLVSWGLVLYFSPKLVIFLVGKVHSWFRN